jgi:hypothetical protein
MSVALEEKILPSQTLLALIEQGIDDIKNGDTVPWNEETRVRIRAEGLKKVDLNIPLASHVIP